MNPPIKWRVSFEVKISILVMCIKAITQLWILVLAYSATQQVNQTAIFITMSSNFLTMCISCQQQVRPRQEGLQCDDCLRWQHRTCSTGVLQSEFERASGGLFSSRSTNVNFNKDKPDTKTAPVGATNSIKVNDQHT